RVHRYLAWAGRAGQRVEGEVLQPAHGSGALRLPRQLGAPVRAVGGPAAVAQLPAESPGSAGVHRLVGAGGAGRLPGRPGRPGGPAGAVTASERQGLPARGGGPPWSFPALAGTFLCWRAGENRNKRICAASWPRFCSARWPATATAPVARLVDGPGAISLPAR